MQDFLKKEKPLRTYFSDAQKSEIFRKKIDVWVEVEGLLAAELPALFLFL